MIAGDLRDALQALRCALDLHAPHDILEQVADRVVAAYDRDVATLRGDTGALVGYDFGKWTVTEDPGGNGQRSVTARCACGVEQRIVLSVLRHKDSTQCAACYQRSRRQDV